MRPSPSADAEGDWQPVSPRLALARRITLLLVYIPIVVIVGVLWWLDQVPSWIAPVVAVAAALGGVWAWWLIGRRVSSFGYLERSEDLLVRSGILFQRLVIVPYGRMQLVDVTAGPIDRALGITSVQLHTAAATTEAVIPGLTPEIAAQVRDRLARAGESRSSGL
jgi:membrane protein YdbS with pleckstrin-like domain